MQWGCWEKTAKGACPEGPRLFCVAIVRRPAVSGGKPARVSQMVLVVERCLHDVTEDGGLGFSV